MIKIMLMIFSLLSICSKSFANEDSTKTALLLIDIQYFYFPGGKWELAEPEKASLNAAKLLEKFRENNSLVVHIRHNAKSDGDIYESVKPINEEKIVRKDNVNCFKETELLSYLQQNNIKKLVICGMMTHMCVEAAARAASDYNFETIIISDACATRALKFDNHDITARDVHYSTLNSVSGYYGKVMTTEFFLNNYSLKVY